MRFLFITLPFLLLCSIAIAKTGNTANDDFGLAMVGTPKYRVADTHLSYANPNAPKRGTLKQSAIGSFDTLNPYTIKGRAATGLNLVTDRLMARVWDEPFTLYPLIAEKAEIPEDRSSITFTLNPKARFHDGSPITADDILFSFETLREHGRPNMRRIYKLASPNKIDQHTIKFTLSGDYDRETVMILAIMPVLSKSYWSDREFNTTTLEPPLGNGPYKIKSAEPGKHITFERVKDYWAANLLTNKGHHNFDEITYDYFRDNTVALESFKKGDILMRREWDAGDWNSSYDFSAIKKGDVIKEELKHGRPDKVRGFIFNTRRAPFDNINVREALNLLFDFDWVNKNLFYGQYKRINSFYPNTDLARTTHNDTKSQGRRAHMRRANALLEKAGWNIKDGKRIHNKTDEVMSFEILTDDPAQEKIALALTRPLKKMGIEARVRVLDSAAYRGRLNEYDFDMILHYWHSTLSPGTEQYLYWSCEAAKQPSRWNYAGICDAKIDELAKSIPEAKTRAELVEKTRALDNKLWDAKLFIPLYYNPLDFVSYWKPLKRPKNVPLYGMVQETWWIEESQTP